MNYQLFTKSSGNIFEHVSKFIPLNKLLILRKINNKLRNKIDKVTYFNEFKKILNLINLEQSNQTSDLINLSINKLCELNFQVFDTQELITLLGYLNFQLNLPVDNTLDSYSLNQNDSQKFCVLQRKKLIFVVFNLVNQKTDLSFQIHRKKIGREFNLIYELNFNNYSSHYNLMCLLAQDLIEYTRIKLNANDDINESFYKFVSNPNLSSIDISNFTVSNPTIFSSSFNDKNSINNMILGRKNFLNEIQHIFFCPEFKIQAIQFDKVLLNDENYKIISLFLKKASDFTTLEIEQCKISKFGAEFLSEAFKINKTIKNVKLNSNNLRAIGANIIFNSLSINNSISKIILSSNAIRFDEFSSLELLKESSPVKELLLWGNDCSDEKGALILADTLRLNKSLEILDLSQNSISSENSKIIFEALVNHPRLTKLYFLMNFLSAIACSSLENLFRGNSQIQTMNLFSNKIDCDGMRLICSGIVDNNSLHEIDLSYNLIRADGINYLSEIVNKTNISCLNLGSNTFSIEGAKILSECLKINKSVITLDLSCCSIGSTGIILFSSTLIENSTLVELLLRDNKIDDKGVEYLASSLKINNTLKFLNLESNYLEETSGFFLGEALKLNKSLTNLNLMDNKLKSGANEILKGLMNNEILTSINLQKNEIEYIDHSYVNNTLCNVNLNLNCLTNDNMRDYKNAMMKNYKIKFLDYE